MLGRTLTDLLELVVDQTRPPLTVAQLKGDAVLSYAFTEGFVTAQTFLERIEETYVEFRRAIDLMVLNNTCKCNACANVSALDLKFFVHYGSFAIQPVGTITQLVGSDVNLIHRLLKNSVTSSTGKTLVTEIPMPLEHVWNYANQSRFRNVIIGSDSYEVVGRKNRRVGAGRTYQCYHGKVTVIQLVMEWLPFERVVLQQLIPIPWEESNPYDHRSPVQHHR